ncbi:MAG: type 1 glutamine amidotransferase [SAR324 cluster bacterium]|nr:type 1 glutamine amidotransferase [SAR324 cluster bacterium]MBL7035460.1 type 1 glutamine amidotransferase [SAR324 cluster bacterium]
MKLGILDTVPRNYWSTDLGITESEKFVDFLQPVMADTTLDQLFVAEGEWPAQLDDYDAYLITGSPCSVNEEYPWIEKLSQFVRDCVKSQIKLAGVCFGHQIIASALGGTVERRREGWFLGMKAFDIVDVQTWMSPIQKQCEIYHINQDHVKSLPPNAECIVHSELCNNSVFVIGDRVLGLQGHPEQPRRSMENFINELLLLGANPEEMEQGRISLRNEVPDANLWGRWIAEFFKH